MRLFCDWLTHNNEYMEAIRKSLFIFISLVSVDERKVLRIGAMDYEPLEQVKRLEVLFREKTSIGVTFDF